MTFSEPLWIAVGGGVAVLVLLGLVGHARRRRRLAEYLGGARAGRRLSAVRLTGVSGGRILLLGLAALALGAAASEPRWAAPPADSARPEPTVVLALDVSGSMQSTDAEPTRLGRSVKVAGTILDALGGRRVALLLHAGKPYVLAPPTRDHAVLRFLLEGVTPDVVSMEDPGTLVSEALEGAGELLTGEMDAGALRSVVLLGDGEGGAEEEAVAAARKLAAEGVRVHAVGVGTAGGSEVVLPVGYQRGGRLVGADGAPVVSRLREDALRRLVGAGGGRYAGADDPDALRALIRALAVPVPGPPRGEGTADRGGRRDAGEERADDAGSDAPAATPASFLAGADLTLWLAAAALLLLLAESLLDLRLPGREPASGRRLAPGRTGAARLAAAGILAVGLVVSSVLVALDRRSLERANRLYRSGEPSPAAELYRRHAESDEADAVASYDLGTALLTLGGAGARRHLGRAAESGEPSVAGRAHYNLGHLHLSRAESAADPDSIVAALEAAVRHGRTALELDPTDADARWNLALARLRLEELLRRARGVNEDAVGHPEDLPFDEGELVRAEGADSALRPPPVDLPPSEEGGATDDAERRRTVVEGAEEALAGVDPGPLERDAALELVRGEGTDAEHLVRRLLWVHRPEVAWWSGEPYPGGER